MTVRTVVADDVADIRLLVRLWLETCGDFEVVGEAENGHEVIDLAATEQPELVILDLAMPEMDGLEALPQILEASPATAVVILSGYDRADFADIVRAAGAIGYLNKRTAGPHLADEVLALLTARA